MRQRECCKGGIEGVERVVITLVAMAGAMVLG